MSDRYLRLAWAAAGITFFLHLLANPHYGFFRDELYFIICGRHPSWGYVDQPPLVPLIAAGSQLFGISLLALRATAALCAAGSVFVIVRIVTQLGGGRFEAIFAAIVVALTPVLAVFGTQVGPDMVGLWLWPLAALYLLRIADGASPRLWLAVGAVLGVSFEGKYSVVFFAVALAIGLALTKERRCSKPGSTEKTSSFLRSPTSSKRFSSPTLCSRGSGSSVSYRRYAPPRCVGSALRHWSCSPK